MDIFNFLFQRVEMIMSRTRQTAGTTQITPKVSTAKGRCQDLDLSENLKVDLFVIQFRKL